LLEELGYSVQIAINGEEGLKLFESSNFDVVVTDFRMPRMDGRELIVRIRQLDPNARVIMLSGFVEPLGLTEQNTGADAVIAKTFNEPAHLLRSVKRLVHRTARKPAASQKNPPPQARVATP
jgi:CheY-like chemotaxis protein